MKKNIQMDLLSLTPMLFFVLMATLTSCNDQKHTRYFGGSTTIKLKPNEKFLNMTWKENNIWVTTQDTLTGIGYSREYSEHGIFNGEVEFLPSKK